MQNANVKPEIGQGINDFIQKHRKPIIVSAGSVALLLVIGIVGLSLADMFSKKAINTVEDFSGRYESMRYSINEEYMENDAAELIAEVESFAKKNSGYAGAKAWSIAGNIHSEKKNWADAETAWIACAEKSAKNYLAPVAWFNAGVAAEEQGKAEQAIECYAKSLSATAGFSSAPSAQFSIGRLRETLNEREAAIAAYRAVISGWPYDSTWTNLAHSRIIALELQ